MKTLGFTSYHQTTNKSQHHQKPQNQQTSEMTNLLQLPFHHYSIFPSSSSSSYHLFQRPRSTVTNRRSMVQYGVPPPQQIKHNYIKCMANPRRVAMVAKQIRRELSDMLLTDKNLQYAVLPEAALGADRYLSSVTTITDVDVSTDLQVVKVYVSIFGDERGREVALAGLKAKSKYVRGQLGKRMKLRLTPEIRFIEDESFERGSRVIAILDKIKNENEQKSSKSQGNREDSSSSAADDEDWEDDDPEEDIIYVR